MKNVNSFNSEHLIKINNQNFRYFDLNVVAKQFDIDLYKVPISIKVILENLIRNEDGENISKSMISNVFSSLKDKNKNRSEFKFTSIDEGLNETIDWFIKNYETCRK